VVEGGDLKSPSFLVVAGALTPAIWIRRAFKMFERANSLAAAQPFQGEGGNGPYFDHSLLMIRAYFEPRTSDFQFSGCSLELRACHSIHYPVKQ
jgi:hypothetical protein